ncbi:hypothetical protein E4U17_003936 [Claviceps sp. LM77 group G4]|nr:hypothetical protein E4U17_003936 [Claviceps sp. LM77 group G4]KAG6070968.1 hypothetical protein E4U33_003945 [Claviceps sp. LM78 group G4]KAG6078941.1 hypothetical protein E4U16_001365 [Claviceps sp. LM84 group G4]
MAVTRQSSRLSDQEGLHPSGTADTTTSAMSKARKRKASTLRSPSPPQGVTKRQQLLTAPTKRRTKDVPQVSPSPPHKTGVPTIEGGTKPRNAKVARLADPNVTNAALLSPETSRGGVALNKMEEPKSPTKQPTAKRKLTTENLLGTACAHLISVDERIRPLVERHHCKIFSAEGLAEKIDPFESLASGIISQQVSGAAAKSIKAKFVALFSANEADGQKMVFPRPSDVVACSLEKLRTAGLSQRKAEYVKGLAEKFHSGELSARMLLEAPYEELVEKLIAVRGLGQWSVEMFACFGLKRMDVFSVGDLGVQRGMAAFMGRDVAKLKSSKGGKWKYMSEKEMLDISEPFAPYRSLFMWLMWRVEDSFTDVSTLE